MLRATRDTPIEVHGVISLPITRGRLDIFIKMVKFVTYPLQRIHRLSWCIKIEAFSACVNGCAQRHQVVVGVGLKRTAFVCQCHVLSLKVFDIL